MSGCICPWWAGYFLASPVRKLFQDPYTILSPYLREGMTVLEIGPGMGFFTLPMAKMIGSRGRIICVDVQDKMIRGLTRRAGHAGLADRIITVLASGESSDLEPYNAIVDFCLLFAVVHEIPDQKRLFREIKSTLKSGAAVLLAEPTGHVTKNDFNRTIQAAEDAGLSPAGSPAIRHSHTAVLRPGKSS